MKNRKVALSTVYGEFNLGNKLQNYAVSEIYRNLGFRAITQVYYEKKSIHTKLKNLIKYNIVRHIKIVEKSKLYNLEYKRERLFKEFSDNYLNTNLIRGSKDILDINNEYILFSVGSDQVWNEDYVKVDNLSFLLGENITIPKIALSASFGKTNIIDKNIFKENLINFNAISVREEQGVNLVENLTGIKATLLSDPTMCLSSSDWSKISVIPKVKPQKKYALLYFLGGTYNYKSNILKYCSQNNLEVVNIFDKKSKYYVCGPREFIYLIENSEVIFTDSFHACVFSIIFNKIFYAFDRNNQKSSMNSRIDTLLSKFGLQELYYSGTFHEPNINWNHINELITTERNKIYNFISDNMLELNLMKEE